MDSSHVGILDTSMSSPASTLVVPYSPNSIWSFRIFPLRSSWSSCSPSILTATSTLPMSQKPLTPPSPRSPLHLPRLCLEYITGGLWLQGLSTRSVSLSAPATLAVAGRQSAMDPACLITSVQTACRIAKRVPMCPCALPFLHPR